MATEAATTAAADALYQLQKTFVHLPADRIDQARRRLAEVERAVEARVREQIATSIENYDGPSPWHLQSVAGGHWIDSRDGVLAARIARGEQP